LKIIGFFKTFIFLIEDGLTWFIFYYFFKSNKRFFLIWHRNWGFGHQITELAFARLRLNELGAKGVLITCGKTNNKFLQSRMAKESFFALHFNLYSTYHAVCEKIERVETVKQINIGFSPIDSIFHYCVRNNLMGQFYSMQEAREKEVRSKISEYRANDILNGKPFLTNEQEEQSRAKLKKIGIGDTDWFVCIHIRSTKSSNHRNNSPESYAGAIQYIEQIGGKVIIIGDENKVLSSLGAKFISNLFPDDEVLMMYILAHQKLFICTNSGPMCISILFDVPILMTNNNEWDYPPYRNKDTYLPKLVFDSIDNRLITVSEFVVFRSSGLLHNLNIHPRFKFIENSSDEILAALKNKFKSIEHNHFDVLMSQKEFRDQFGSESTAQFSPARIDEAFFEKYKAVFLG
jgi:putative glycosyltransferase (TIGR04372 family)